MVRCIVEGRLTDRVCRGDRGDRGDVGGVVVPRQIQVVSAAAAGEGECEGRRKISQTKVQRPLSRLNLNWSSGSSLQLTDRKTFRRAATLREISGELLFRHVIFPCFVLAIMGSVHSCRLGLNT